MPTLETLHQRIEIQEGNIVRQKVDAIVNAANERLLGGGGVDGAIHQAAGPELLEECRKLNGCPTGQAKITAGYNLPAKWVIHAVGPIWHGGRSNEDALLASCYRNSLVLAESRGIRSIAFPCISTGLYRFPIERAADIALNETLKFIEQHDLPERINFVCYGHDTYSIYLDAARRILPGFSG
ncbi:MAG: O-acetyl-ADP-ribose deacetylase [Verrucomicrobia bacterium]|nr:O-acetyl-ADP-ribose deacetylase [Verrucomicrobiota bacterium]